MGIPGEKPIERWRGEFGDAYIQRNPTDGVAQRARTSLWGQVMRCLAGREPTSILEVGSNIGGNLRALRSLSRADLHAVEPNPRARQALAEEQILPSRNIHDGSATSISLPDASIDLVFTCGVLIHVPPEDLGVACREMHRVSSRYIACVEYFAEQPTTIGYHGHGDMLFLRDFGSFWLDQHSDLTVLDYGFVWRRLTGFDSLVWQVFEKAHAQPSRASRFGRARRRNWSANGV
jgi:spore coat polysaccharide biosynthesis protein SpsF